jgi:hypothetical protein
LIECGGHSHTPESGGFGEEGSVLGGECTSILLGHLTGGGNPLDQVTLIPHNEDDKVFVGLLSQVLYPFVEALESLILRYVVGYNCSTCSSEVTLIKYSKV